jgi:hypothetical protein
MDQRSEKDNPVGCRARPKTAPNRPKRAAFILHSSEQAFFAKMR